MVFQSDSETMRRRTRESGGRNQAGQRRRPGLESSEHQGRFV
jgi:hypothetical protein